MIFEFSNYSLSIFLIHIALASITLFIAIRFFFLLRHENDLNVKKAFFLSISSFLLILLMGLGILEPLNKNFSGHFYTITWFFGLFTYYLYLSALKSFLSIEKKLYGKIQKIYLLVLVFYFIDMIYFLATENSFLATHTTEKPSRFFEEMNYYFKPNILGQVLSGVCGLSFFINAFILLGNIRKRNSKERIVFFGIILSIIGLLNDSVLGSGLFYYGYPLSFLGCIFELTRFLNFYIGRSQKRIDELSQSLSKSSKAAHVGLISGSIAHDIKNSLFNINITLKFINKIASEEHVDKDKIKKYAKVIEESSLKINSITDSYLKILHSKDSTADEIEDFLIEEVILDAVLDLEPVTEERGIKVGIRLSNEKTLRLNKVEIYIAILNLLKNSCDAIENLEDKEIMIEEEIVSGEYLVKFIDSGDGIPMDIQEKIFDPQFSTKEKSKGTGLGLSIVKEILKRNNCRISIDNNAPTTCFILNFGKAE